MGVIQLRLFINSRAALPIYQQLITQVKSAVASGMLQPGQQLPSVRDLAGQLAINPNTVAKAYSILENQGVIFIRQGAGTFVSQSPETKPDRAILQQKLNEVVVEAYHQGLSTAQTKILLDKTFKKWNIREVD